MKKRVSIFFIYLLLFFAVLFGFLLILNRNSMQITNDFKKDNQMVEVENNEQQPLEEFKSDEVFGKKFYYFEIFIFFLAPIVALYKTYKTDKDQEFKKFAWSFIFFYLIFSFVIAEFIINHLIGSLYRWVKSEKYSFLLIFKNSFERRLRIINLVLLLGHLVFAGVLFWIGWICLILNLIIINR